MRLATMAFVLLVAGTGHAAMLDEGATFPEWKLTDHTGASVSSADLAGTTYVLWFYPKASTPGCTIEGNEFTKRFDQFKERGIRVFGVSFDSPTDNAKFVEQQGFPFKLLSDDKRTLAIAVGAADNATQGYAKRISYLVDGAGKVSKAYDEVKPSQHATEVLGDIPWPL